jgi:SEC-C motif-containing protein
MAVTPTKVEIEDETRACPCGSGKLFSACCLPIHTGERTASTAEELMRARFSAHAVGDFAFLHRSYKPTANQPYVPSSENPTTQWTRLVIHSHTQGRTPDISYVEFSAYGLEQGVEHVLHEKAEFFREDGVWVYTRPLREGPAPFVAAEKKPGRNDPCPCGSGKKYKHCCLLKA